MLRGRFGYRLSGVMARSGLTVDAPDEALFSNLNEFIRREKRTELETTWRAVTDAKSPDPLVSPVNVELGEYDSDRGSFPVLSLTPSLYAEKQAKGIDRPRFLPATTLQSTQTLFVPMDAATAQKTQEALAEG